MPFHVFVFKFDPSDKLLTQPTRKKVNESIVITNIYLTVYTAHDLVGMERYALPLLLY